MTMTRICGVVLALGLVAVGCGDSDGGDGDGGTPGGGGNGSNGTSGGSSGGSSGMPGVDDCSEDNSTGGDEELPGTCTQAEYDAYVECSPSMCDAEYKEAFGDNYASGTFAGTCGDYFGCVNDCDCDNTCIAACTQSEACKASSTKLANCSASKCPIPGCFTGGAGSGSGKTCADLEACCGGMAAGDMKDQCDTLLMSSQGMDIACGAYFTVAGCQ